MARKNLKAKLPQKQKQKSEYIRGLEKVKKVVEKRRDDALKYANTYHKDIKYTIRDMYEVEAAAFQEIVNDIEKLLPCNSCIEF